MQLIIIRHGETIHSSKLCFQKDDSSLTSKAKIEAEQLEKYIKIINPTLFIGSKLIRSKQTINILNDTLKKDVKLSHLFNEIREPLDIQGEKYLLKVHLLTLQLISTIQIPIIVIMNPIRFLTF